ncbi:hypothetical protein [Microbispora sp. H10670]|uniref:hypothetical protein n=1 Tax=Microbispora sp. H10670 TaxID=2729108 RepID=UPI0015FF617F|nr:hypothetical protein [Microbispora sp. H10670]
MTDRTAALPGSHGQAGDTPSEALSDAPDGFPSGELLARSDLYGAEHLLGHGTQRPRESGVDIARPFVYPVPDETLSPVLRGRAATTGVRHYEALFAFDLEELPSDRHYTGVRFEVRLADDDAVALRLGMSETVLDDVVGPWPGSAPSTGSSTGSSTGPSSRLSSWPESGAPAAPPGTEGRYRRLVNRLRNVPGDPEPRVFGARRPSFGFILSAEPGRPLARRSYGLRVLLELPGDVPDLAGSLVVGTTISRVRRTRSDLLEAALATAETFGEPLPTPERPQAEARQKTGGAVVRLCVATDIEKYSRFTDDEAALRAQERLVTVLAAARRRAGIDESGVDLQEQGDGQFAVLPPDIEERRVIPDLVRALRLELHDVNAELNRDAMLRLRVAICRGSVRRGANGYVGRTVIAVHRVLDAPSVRAALANEEAAMMVIAVSDSVFMEVVAQGSGDLDPADFQQVSAKLPEKGFEETAWILVPPPVRRAGNS